jgi:hypothetical protein
MRRVKRGLQQACLCMTGYAVRSGPPNWLPDARPWPLDDNATGVFTGALPKPVSRFLTEPACVSAPHTHIGITSMTHTGEVVSMTRSSARPEVWSSSPNSASVRSRAVPNMAIMWVSTR